MAGLQIVTQPTEMAVALPDMKNFLKVEFPDDDALISALIGAATELVEVFTSRSLINKLYVQSLDSFPYYTDTVMSQMAFPPSYYSMPRWSTTLWNYSQMIKLFVSPLVAMTRIAYLSSDDQQYHSLLPTNTLPWFPGQAYAANAEICDNNGNIQQSSGGTAGDNPPTWSRIIGGTTSDGLGSTQITWVNQGPAPLNIINPGGGQSTTFFVDSINEPPRLFPGPAGSFWPPVLYVPNAVQIFFTAGYGNDATTIPPTFVTAIMQLVAGWYEHREAISPLSLREMPNHVKMLLWSKRVLDFQPTRG